MWTALTALERPGWILSESLWRQHTRPICWFWTSGRQIYGRISFCCLKHQVWGNLLWHHRKLIYNHPCHSAPFPFFISTWHIFKEWREWCLLIKWLAPAWWLALRMVLFSPHSESLDSQWMREDEGGCSYFPLCRAVASSVTVPIAALAIPAKGWICLNIARHYSLLWANVLNSIFNFHVGH